MHQTPFWKVRSSALPIAVASVLAVSSAIGFGLFADPTPNPAPPELGTGGQTPPSGADDVVFMRQVLPILTGKCARCHNSQAHFLHNWLDYDTAYSHRWEIKRRVWDSWQGHYYKAAMPLANGPESLVISADERETIQRWVAAGAPKGTPAPVVIPKNKAERIEAGKRIFTAICAACHQTGGQGVPKLFPPLASSDFLNADKDRAIATVLNGRQGEIVVNGAKYNNQMPPVQLGDQDIASVLTYVYNSFGNSGLEVEPDEVAAVRAQPPGSRR
jgi:mono/diheme cytochrome c family protein